MKRMKRRAARTARQGERAHYYTNAEQIARIASRFAFDHLRGAVQARSAHDVGGVLLQVAMRFSGIALSLAEIA